MGARLRRRIGVDHRRLRSPNFIFFFLGGMLLWELWEEGLRQPRAGTVRPRDVDVVASKIISIWSPGGSSPPYHSAIMNVAMRSATSDLVQWCPRLASQMGQPPNQLPWSARLLQHGQF